MSVVDSPTFLRFQLGAQLRRLRDVAGVSTDHAAHVIDVTASTMRRIEGGRVGIRGPALTALLNEYGVDDSELRGTMLTMARSGKQRGWWAKYGDLPLAYRQYIGLESAAEQVDNFETIVVPGLLQTEAYSRAINNVKGTGRTSEAVEQRVTARLERQKLITEGHLKLAVVMDEAVLRRQIGGQEVMREQLGALLTMAKMWNVSLQVIPFNEGAYASMLSSFHVLRFSAGLEVVYIEGLTGDLYAEGDDIARCKAVFDSLRSSALSPTASATMIREVRDAINAT
jgi:transcriptional regulator with XRE-family HTH domain